jgi:hypothetical protein
VAARNDIASADSRILGEPLTLAFPVLGARAPTVTRMKRIHALIISLVLALAVVFGASAAIRSTQLSAAAHASHVVYKQVPPAVHVVQPVHAQGEEGGFDD